MNNFLDSNRLEEPEAPRFRPYCARLHWITWVVHYRHHFAYTGLRSLGTRATERRRNTKQHINSWMKTKQNIVAFIIHVLLFKKLCKTFAPKLFYARHGVFFCSTVALSWVRGEEEEEEAEKKNEASPKIYTDCYGTTLYCHGDGLDGY